MNIFELYNIPETFFPDQALVKKKFYALSRQYHPDFAGDLSDVEKAVLLEQSAQVNKAYKIFQDLESLMGYILKEKGILEEEEKYQLDPDFLMEVMDLNEQLMDEENKSEIDTALTTLKTTLYEDVQPILENYNRDTVTEKELLQIKDYYFRQKYLKRIEEGLNRQ